MFIGSRFQSPGESLHEKRIHGEPHDEASRLVAEAVEILKEVPNFIVRDLNAAISSASGTLTSRSRRLIVRDEHQSVLPN